MDKSLYIAMTGARENMLGQQVRANNLANVTTNGFKADFEQARAMRVFGDGHASRVYSQSERPGTNLSSGALIETGRNLDIAIHGPGWIAVQSPDGTEAYTRGGELQINAANELVTGNGLPVLGAGGAPIVLPPAQQVDISYDGAITVRPQGDPAAALVQVDVIKTVLPEPGTFFKGPDGMMRTDDMVPLPVAAGVQLRSGYVESSNVNAVNELTSIISLSRQFSMQVKMMKNAEENSSAAGRILQN
ncbi:flagellar basal body rod protein FlgF [Nitrincola sp. MINF-07-Sa-05]|uniref:flagellar basal body rod protein FlgF n=1 Tax=Nitrincola salilacus TaxID=3400273 RepID=UPI0039183C91